MIPIGIRSLAVRFPSIVRTNDYWRNKYPHVVAESEQRTLAQVFNPADSSEDSYPFDTEMRPYLGDPFRGTVERRALGPSETTLSLEQAAAEEALAAAGLAAEDVDLLICCALPSEHLGLGDAAFLAGRLGLRAAAWNLDSMCASTLLAYQTACGLIQAGQHRNVLVVISCTYSRVMDEEDTLSWFLGDGAGAFVVGSLARGQGLLGAKSFHTAETCGAFAWDLSVDTTGTPRIAVKAGKSPGRALRDSSAPVLRKCCVGATKEAGVELRDIDFFVFNTPTAWFDKFAARALEIDPQKTISTYPLYANIGPALTTANLYHAAHSGLIGEGSLVLVYAVGSVSSAGAAVMRWGNAGLGPLPTPSAQLVRV